MIPSIDGIIRAVAQHRGFTPEDITGRARGVHGKTTAARNLAFWLAREAAKGKLEEIAVEFDHRDHSSIVYGIQCHERAMADDGHVRRLTEFLAARCKRDVAIRDMIRRRVPLDEAVQALGLCKKQLRQDAKRIGLSWGGNAARHQRRVGTVEGRLQSLQSLRKNPKNWFEAYNLHLLSARQLEDYRTLTSSGIRRAAAAAAIGRRDILKPHEINREAA